MRTELFGTNQASRMTVIPWRALEQAGIDKPPWHSYRGQGLQRWGNGRCANLMSGQKRVFTKTLKTMIKRRNTIEHAPASGRVVALPLPSWYESSCHLGCGNPEFARSGTTIV